MKILKLLSIASVLMGALASCEEEMHGVNTTENVKVYLPAAQGQNNIFSPLDSGSVKLDLMANTVNFPIPVIRGGFSDYKTFTVNVAKDDAGVNALIADGKLPEGTVLLPADRYNLASTATLIDTLHQNRGLVVPQLHLQNLSDFQGKKVALGIQISSASEFSINEEQNTTILLIDIDRLAVNYLIVDVTTKYLKNPGFPFQRKDEGTGRWGLLKDWDTSKFENGSFVSDDNGLFALESNGWNASGVTNGKISQTIELPAGTYSFGMEIKDFAEWNGSADSWDSPEIDVNFAVAAGTSLPDIGDLNNALSVYKITGGTAKGSIVETPRFTLTEKTTITFGMVATIPTEVYFQARKFILTQNL